MWHAYMAYMNESQTEVTKRRSALSVCPCGCPLGDTPSIINSIIFLGPYEAPKGTNTKVTSAKGHLCAYPKRYGQPTSCSIWISEGSTRADSKFRGVEFLGPQDSCNKLGLIES